MSDDLLQDHDSTQPRCQDCGVIMRDEDAGWRCPECERFEPAMHGPLPAPFEGPGIRGG